MNPNEKELRVELKKKFPTLFYANNNNEYTIPKDQREELTTFLSTQITLVKEKAYREGMLHMAASLGGHDEYTDKKISSILTPQL